MGWGNVGMILEKLQDINKGSVANKKIYCYEKSLAYLEELCQKYIANDQIEAVIDDNARYQGEFVFNGKKIIVQGSETLEKIDWPTSVILITSDYYLEAYEKLCSLKAVNDNADVIYYFENQETEYEMKYRDQYKTAKLENTIIFRSGPHASSYIEGTDFSDNARALFEYMITNGYNKKYELVWLVKHPEEYARYKVYENVYFLSFDWSVSDDEREREKYYRALCLAKYLFFTDAYGFARNCRMDQIRVQLWHGCGFKTRVNFVRCENRYEYTTVISEVYSKIHQDVYGLREDQMLVTGYAKQDWLFTGLKEEKWKSLSIPNHNRCIFWLPTFRTAAESLNNLSERQRVSDTGLPIMDTMDKLVALNDLLEKQKLTLIVKLHPFQKKSTINCKGMSHIILLDNHELFARDIQINQLLSRADALISDYSSVAVDYMLLDRPIAFTLDDVEEYALTRGFVFENILDWLPGELLYTFDDFCFFVNEISKGKDISKEKRTKLTSKMHKFRDGNNCERILKALEIHG